MFEEPKSSIIIFSVGDYRTLISSDIRLSWNKYGYIKYPRTT